MGEGRPQIPKGGVATTAGADDLEGASCGLGELPSKEGSDTTTFCPHSPQSVSSGNVGNQFEGDGLNVMSERSWEMG